MTFRHYCTNNCFDGRTWVVFGLIQTPFEKSDFLLWSILNVELFSLLGGFVNDLHVNEID